MNTITSIRDLSRIRSYDEASAYLDGANSRSAGNNTTVLRLDPARIGVRLHRTIVVAYDVDGSITLNSGGWRTVTTLQRIRALTPPSIRILTNQGEWTFADDGLPFVDGIRIAATSGQ